jgi:hypothetical protein
MAEHEAKWVVIGFGNNGAKRVITYRCDVCGALFECDPSDEDLPGNHNGR